MDIADPPTRRIPIDPQDLKPSPDAVARYFGGPGYSLTPKVQKKVAAGIDRALSLVNPLAGYRVISAESNGESADIPFDVAEFSVRYFAVYLATLGGGLEAACRELSDRSQMFQAMLLDAVGTAMLDILGSEIEKALDLQARRMELFTGCRMGPGLNDMALENQTWLFNLLEAEALGVHLHESFVMSPSKSISAIVMFSDSEQQEISGDKCSHCKMKRCQFRVRPN